MEVTGARLFLLEQEACYLEVGERGVRLTACGVSGGQRGGWPEGVRKIRRRRRL
jgi:hypothetical protein